MDAGRILREYADDARAHQIEDDTYGVFVAMPFRDQFSYRSKEILDKVINNAIQKANNSIELKRKFRKAIRADQMIPNASNISDEIVRGILFNHFFMADLTFANHGVLVELGVALTVKPLNNIVLIAQGKSEEIHFDIQDNRIIWYDNKRSRNDISCALVEGAKAFESNIESDITALRKKLSPQAVYILNVFGRLKKDNPKAVFHFGILKNDNQLSNNNEIRELIFNRVVTELQSHKLLELDYRIADDGINDDSYGLTLTKLGMVFIRKTWPRQLGTIE